MRKTKGSRRRATRWRALAPRSDKSEIVIKSGKLVPADLLDGSGQDCRNKFLESRIAAQWIKVGIDRDEVRDRTSVIARILFQPIQCLVLFSKRKVNHGKSVCGDITCPGGFRNLIQQLSSFILPSSACLSMAHEPEHCWVIA